MPADKYLVIKGKGGMGNRMLCALTGLLYGELTGRKTIIDWRDACYSDDGSNAFGSLFHNDHVCPVNILPRDASIRPAIWNGNLHKSMVEMVNEYDNGNHASVFLHLKYSVDVRKLDYDEDVLVFWNYMHCIPSLWSHLRRHSHPLGGLSTQEVIKRGLKAYLPPAEAVKEKVRQFKAAHWHDSMIGVHIRHTDRKMRLSKYERPLQRQLLRTPDARIFLATDNRSVMESYRGRYPDLCSTTKWFPEGMRSMHQNPTCPDKLANGIDALTDMFLLSKCDCLIYPRCSTFSWLSSLLSDASERRKIDVDRFDPRVIGKRLVWRFLT